MVQPVSRCTVEHRQDTCLAHDPSRSTEHVGCDHVVRSWPNLGKILYHELDAYGIFVKLPFLNRALSSGLKLPGFNSLRRIKRRGSVCCLFSPVTMEPREDLVPEGGPSSSVTQKILPKRCVQTPWSISEPQPTQSILAAFACPPPLLGGCIQISGED